MVCLQKNTRHSKHFNIHLTDTLKNQLIWNYVFDHGQTDPVDVPKMITINLEKYAK